MRLSVLKAAWTVWLETGCLACLFLKWFFCCCFQFFCISLSSCICLSPNVRNCHLTGQWNYALVLLSSVCSTSTLNRAQGMSLYTDNKHSIEARSAVKFRWQKVVKLTIDSDRQHRSGNQLHFWDTIFGCCICCLVYVCLKKPQAWLKWHAILR